MLATQEEYGHAYRERVDELQEGSKPLDALAVQDDCGPGVELMLFG
jgi:hypothetical protein